MRIGLAVVALALFVAAGIGAATYSTPQSSHTAVVAADANPDGGVPFN